MSQQAQSVENMHHDHVHWRSEALAWQDDLGRWRDEYNDVRSVVTDLQEFLGNHERALLDHGEVVENGDRRMAVHEKKLADFMETGKVAPLEDMFDVHTR